MRSAWVLATALVGAPPPPGDAAPGWRPLADRDGIETWRREGAGGEPWFRGRTLVPATPLVTLAALIDPGPASPGPPGCVESRLLAHPAPLRWVVYRRSRAPVRGVADRDMVLEAVLRRVSPGPGWQLAFSHRAGRGVPPPPPGVVRVAALRGQFTCTEAGQDLTWVDYEVALDPGGQLPRWAAQRAAARLPEQTLAALRGRVGAPQLLPVAASLAVELAAAEAGPPQIAEADQNLSSRRRWP